MIGVAGWLVWRRAIAPRPLRLWGWQLAANALLDAGVFRAAQPAAGARRVPGAAGADRADHARLPAGCAASAAWLMAPYLAWTGYATYLTAGFWWLNPT